MLAHHRLLEMSDIEKAFGAQTVLHRVGFDLSAGEVHVLAGENGAGKSTLIKILGGVHTNYGGRMAIRGRAVRFRSPRHATAHGVAVIHQELSLVPDLSAADNIFLGHEHSTAGWLRGREHRARAAEVLTRLGLHIDVRRPTGSFSIATQQLIEIAKALVLEATIIVMDEPTSALREPEVERLFACIAELKKDGCGIVYITHKLEEVYHIGDRITVLRDGRWIITAPASELPAADLVRHMVGRDATTAGAGAPPFQGWGRDSQDPIAPPRLKTWTTRTEGEVALPRAHTRGIHARAASPPRLAVGNLTLGRHRFQAGASAARPVVDDVTFDVRGGEVVGLAGLEGSGNSALLWGLFGAHRGRVTGRVLLDGKPYCPTSPRRAIRHGLALVTNDRQRTGLVLDMGVAANLALASLPRVSPRGCLNRTAEMHLAEATAKALDLRAASLRQPVSTLSGGNQQKVVLGKWLNTDPRVLLLDEPTRGVDVGAKQEIYQLMQRWKDAGQAIVLITSELPELLSLSDKIIVMHRGRVAARFERSEATPQRILHAAMGGTADND